MRAFRLTLLVVLTSLAGCASQPPPPIPSQPSPAIAPQPPAPEPLFTQTGMASFYGRAHQGKITASGDNFDSGALTAAHRTLAFGTLVRVTNLDNGQAVTVTITDRGPYVRKRIIDLSLAAAKALGMQDKGVARVRLEAMRAISPVS
jgi:rare lipoprotein A